jgi:hypothetical protein
MGDFPFGIYIIKLPTFEANAKAIRRFRVRIPGRFRLTCWPNGKAPDYGCKLFAMLAMDGSDDCASIVQNLLAVQYDIFERFVNTKQALVNGYFDSSHHQLPGVTATNVVSHFLVLYDQHHEANRDLRFHLQQWDEIVEQMLGQSSESCHSNTARNNVGRRRRSRALATTEHAASFLRRGHGVIDEHYHRTKRVLLSLSASTTTISGGHSDSPILFSKEGIPITTHQGAASMAQSMEQLDDSARLDDIDVPFDDDSNDLGVVSDLAASETTRVYRPRSFVPLAVLQASIHQVQSQLFQAKSPLGVTSF